MSRIQTVIVIFLAVWLASGCGIARRGTYPGGQNGSESGQSEETESSSSTTQQPIPARSISSLNATQVSLMQAYRDWKGTPYRLGGATKDGVDCSMLVNIIFDEYFGIELPKNTRSQLNAGKGIRRAAVRTGDLVFFKTGRKTLHVGIAVNSGEFLHASTSEGVMISKLGNSYWRNRYLAARRVL
jgi:cell wall-associated NlpC family hydrolase